MTITHFINVMLNKKARVLLTTVSISVNNHFTSNLILYNNIELSYEVMFQKDPMSSILLGLNFNCDYCYRCENIHRRKLNTVFKGNQIIKIKLFLLNLTQDILNEANVNLS